MSQKNLQQNISRLMALLLCLMLILPCVPAVYAASGTCGSNLTWSVDGTRLIISGSGAMHNYSEDSPAPWYSYRESIISISLPEGMTRIGSWAFADCTNLLSVTIPGSVEVIDESAFRRCTSLTMLTLNEGLRTVGVCAFEQCESLADLRLPNTLINLYDHAFYMCDSLSYVTIPGAVRTIGSGVFCYCESLLRVDVNAAVTMPSWSFYGCDKLEIVTIRGESVDPESLKISTPPTGIPGYNPSEDDEDPAYEEPAATTPPITESVTPSYTPDTGSAYGESITTGSSGEQIVDKTTVTRTDNSTTVSTTKTPVDEQGSATTVITSTVQNDKGWEDVIQKVNSATIGGNKETVQVTVYLPNDETVKAEVLEALAGKNVSLNIQTQSGSQFTLDCSKLGEKIEDDLVLSYTLALMEDVPEELEGCVVYKLVFLASAEISTELVIRLPGEYQFSTATLYQMKNSKPEQLQSVLVDGSGNAHWYVSSVDQKTDYLIGINVPGTDMETPIIPDELQDVYQVENLDNGVQYVVTGRTSSWGMGLGQVMGILAIVMVSVIVIVGVVMYIWNKKRLKNGYVPDWDDDDYE